MRKTIMVVDDDAKILLGLKKRLEHEGYRVITALDGKQALEVARDNAIDAISLDLQLPGDMSGLDIAGALRADPHTSQIPVVFITGSADEEFKSKSAGVGAKYFLSKPYDSDLLIQMLRGIFGQDELAEMQRISSAKRRQPISNRAIA